jgi:hypothetical protein
MAHGAHAFTLVSRKMRCGMQLAFSRGMRLIAPCVLAALLLASSSARATSSEITCDWPTPSFGWKLPSEPIPAAYLDDVPIDGVIRIPVDHAVGFHERDAVDPMSAVVITVRDAGGTVIPGTVKIAATFLSGNSPIADGSPRILEWRAASALAPASTYSVVVHFDNGKLTSCPAAITRESTLTVHTGTSYAKDLLVAGSVTTATLGEVRYNSSGGCCETTVGDPCTREGRCTQCWKSIVQTQVEMDWTTPLPSPYFEYAIKAVDTEAELSFAESIALKGVGSLQATVPVRGEQYCFVLETRSVSDGTTVTSPQRCVADRDRAAVGEAPPATRVLSNTCKDAVSWAPSPAQTNVFLDVTYGKDVADAYGLPATPVTTPADNHAATDEGGCAFVRARVAEPSAATGLFLLSLGAFARRRRKS